MTPCKSRKDGVENYSFGARDTTQQRQQQDNEGEEGQAQTRGRSRDPRVRANVTWSKDSRAFFITRTDQRKVADLYLIDMLAEPRPKLTTYKYPMPGEENRAPAGVVGVTSAGMPAGEAGRNPQVEGPGDVEPALGRRRLREAASRSAATGCGRTWS